MTSHCTLALAEWKKGNKEQPLPASPCEGRSDSVSPLLQNTRLFVTKCKPCHRNIDAGVIGLMAVDGQLPAPIIIKETIYESHNA
jgi:hypothetical protein